MKNIFNNILLLRSQTSHPTSVLVLGTERKEIFSCLQPAFGVCLDNSKTAIYKLKENYPSWNYVISDFEDIKIARKFDYVIITDIVKHLKDIWLFFRNLKKLTTQESKIIVYYKTSLRGLILEKIKFYLNSDRHRQNIFILTDLENLLNLNGYEVIQKKRWGIIKPFHLLVAKNEIEKKKLQEFTCSVIIPTKDEAGNIEEIVKRIPQMGKGTELIFVDGNSKDGTVDRIKESIKNHPERNIKLIHQGPGKGKADAVKKGIASARGDLLFILDADLSVSPEDLPKFYSVFSEGRADFINGTRFIYPMEKSAMPFLNKLANKFFAIFFSIILKQRITDTLCGTKVIVKSDFEKINNLNPLNGLDPFGDFELLIGARILKLKIVELPVRYKARTYGKTKIHGFREGLRLLRLCLIALKRLEFI